MPKQAEIKIGLYVKGDDQASEDKLTEIINLFEELADKILDENDTRLNRFILQINSTRHPRKNVFCRKRGRLLEDWIQEDSLSWHNEELEKFYNKRIVQEFDGCYHSFPGKGEYVYFWVLLETGHAVGFNENPSRGWSYPVKSLKNVDPELYKWARNTFK